MKLKIYRGYEIYIEEDKTDIYTSDGIYIDSYYNKSIIEIENIVDKWED